MNPPPARGRSRGSGPLPAGVSAAELLAVVAIGTLLLAVIVPALFHLRAAVCLRSAAAETSGALLLARAYAISRGRNVAVKFRKNGPRHEWALYGDGNGNGVLNLEIRSGVDPPLGVFFPWMRNDVLPGILTGNRVPDPGQPGRYLDRVDDPIRFNNSDLCSFSPMGESTPGSVYLWDGHDRMAVVRVFGRTAKVRTLYHLRGERGWRK